MTKVFNIDLDLTYKEYLKAILYLTIRMTIIKKLFWFITILGVLNALSNIFLSPKGVTYWYEPIVSLIFPLLFLIGFFGIAIQIISFILYQARPKYFRDVVYSFNQSGVEKTGDGWATSTPWKNIIKTSENRDFFFLFITANDAHIVQKKNFDSLSQLNEFRTLMEESRRQVAMGHNKRF